MGIRISQVDAFTNQKFAGNPAAVCVLSQPAEESWMQNVAAEMNLSETAFATSYRAWSKLQFSAGSRLEKKSTCAVMQHWRPRMFSGRKATCQPVSRPTSETRSGLLTAQSGLDGIELDFPSERVHERVTDASTLAELQSALGAPFKFAGRNRFDLLVELETEELVRKLRPDIRRLEQFPVRGVIVTGRASSPEYHFVSRFFCAQSWCRRRSSLRLGALLFRSVLGGKTRSFLARSPSSFLPRRSGERCASDGNRVALIGHAVTVLRGELV